MLAPAVLVAVIVCFRVAADVDPYGQCVARTNRRAARFSFFCKPSPAGEGGLPQGKTDEVSAVFAVQISSTSSASHKFGTFPTGEGLGVREQTAAPRGFPATP